MCQAQGLGYRIALDDFSWHPKYIPIAKLADYIRWILSRWTRLAAGVVQAAPWHFAVLVAEKVETQEEYKQACKEGFTLFQGYYSAARCSCNAADSGEQGFAYPHA